jgi:SAM-dependent methyltransferase
MSTDATHDAYADARVVAFYARGQSLQPAEELLFRDFLRPGMDVLDLGVGAGRTTPFLSALAGRYVGADYSEAMVAHCRAAFPHLRFEVADAAALERFDDASFDAVVFSFNGLDSIQTLDGRRACLRECARVLRRDGVFVFSSHNARHLFVAPVLAGASPWRRAWRLAYALLHSALLLATRLWSGARLRGCGYLLDLTPHGFLRMYVTSPEVEAAELADAGLRVARVVPGPSADARWPPAVPWYYYACVKGAAR